MKYIYTYEDWFIQFTQRDEIEIITKTRIPKTLENGNDEGEHTKLGLTM